jgi:hypothetical protein
VGTIELSDPETDYFTEAIVRQFMAMDPDLLVLDLLGGGCGLVVYHIVPLCRDVHRML